MVLTSTLLLLLGSVISAQGTTLTDEQKCDLLAAALNRVWNSLPDQRGHIMSPFYRLSKPGVMEAFRLHVVPRGVPADHTLDTEAGRRLIACRAASIHSLQDVADQTGMPIGLIRPHYETMQRQWTGSLGGADGMRDMAVVLQQVAEFKQRTGLPNFPLQNTNEDEIRTFLTDLLSHRIIQLRFPQNQHPMLTDPDRMARALMSSSRDEFLRESGMDAIVFMGVERRLQYVGQMVPIVQAVTSLAEALETTGLMQLQ